MKTLDRSVETLGRECNLRSVIRVALIMSDYVPGCDIVTNFSSFFGN